MTITVLPAPNPTSDTVRRRHRRVAFGAALTLALLAAGCSDDAPDSSVTTTTETPSTEAPPTSDPVPGTPDLAGLAPVISCGDAALVFATPDDRTLVQVDVPGLLATAERTGGPFELVVDLADPEAGATATLE